MLLLVALVLLLLLLVLALVALLLVALLNDSGLQSIELADEEPVDPALFGCCWWWWPAIEPEAPAKCCIVVARFRWKCIVAGGERCRRLGWRLRAGGRRVRAGCWRAQVFVAGKSCSLRSGRRHECLQ